jgi:hypothetical protein
MFLDRINKNLKQKSKNEQELKCFIIELFIKLKNEYPDCYLRNVRDLHVFGGEGSWAIAEIEFEHDEIAMTFSIINLKNNWSVNYGDGPILIENKGQIERVIEKLNTISWIKQLSKDNKE